MILKLFEVAKKNPSEDILSLIVKNSKEDIKP